MNALLYHAGGALLLDERFEQQPSSCTVTVRTLQDAGLTSLGFDADIEDEEAAVVDLELTLAAAARGAKQVTVSAATGEGASQLLSPGFRVLLVDTTGRKQWAKVDGVAMSEGDPSVLYIDEGLDFALNTGAKAYGLRCSYEVDWATETATFTGEVKVTWKVTVGDRVFTRIYVVDIVKQELAQPATWADVVLMRPDADDQMSRVKDKDGLVRVAWSHLISHIRKIGVYHNLIVPDGTTDLRDALVYQTLYMLTRHQGLTPPADMTGAEYQDNLMRDRDSAIQGLPQPIDANEDGALDGTERDNNHVALFFRHRRRPRRVTS